MKQSDIESKNKKEIIRQLIRTQYETDNILFVPAGHSQYAQNGVVKIFCAWRYLTKKCKAYKTFFHKGLNENVIVITRGV